MRHLRADYDAIQPWPVPRKHIVRHDGMIRGLPDSVGPGDDDHPLIPDDEPVFLLRGQDPAAAEAVRHWAEIVAQHLGDPEMVTRVREWADEMEKYAMKAKHGPPDVPEGQLRSTGSW